LCFSADSANGIVSSILDTRMKNSEQTIFILSEINIEYPEASFYQHGLPPGVKFALGVNFGP
jgi:hypothetical protein